jgi:hypothetical protein
LLAAFYIFWSEDLYTERTYPIAMIQTMVPGPRLGQMIAAMVITYTAAFAAVVLRIISRRLVGVRLGFDDYTAVAALVSLALHHETIHLI